MERTPPAAHLHSAHSYLRCVALRGPFICLAIRGTRKKKVQQQHGGVGGSGGGASHRGVTLRPPVPILREREEKEGVLPLCQVHSTPLHKQAATTSFSPGHIFRTVPSLDMSYIETQGDMCASLGVVVGMAGRGPCPTRPPHIGRQW